jgi:type I restriction enzyme S subunit
VTTEKQRPEGWASVELPDAVSLLQNGPFGSLLHRSDYVSDCVPLINPAHIIDGQLKPDPDITVGPDVTKRLASYVMRPGDVVIGRRGEMGRAALITAERDSWFCGTGCAFVRPSAATYPPFLALWIGSPEVRQTLETESVGVTMKNLSTRILRRLRLALPPLAEQRRIVEKVEALLEQVNRAKARIDRVPLILKRFGDALLAAACAGELTRAWRQQNGCELDSSRDLETKLADRMTSEPDRRVRTEHVASAPTNPDDKRPEKNNGTPPGWRWVTLNDVCDDITVGHVGPMTKEYVDRGVPFLRSLNVRPFQFDSRDLKFISRSFHQRLAKSSLKPGDLVVVRSGNAGVACVVPPELVEANCADLVVMRPGAALNPDYAAIFLNSAGTRAHVEGVKVGIAQAHFNIGSARQTPLLLPPLTEQREIVRKTHELQALAASVGRRAEDATLWVNSLPQAILSRAFSGQLVPTEAEVARAEGRSYETAEELMARVRSINDHGARKPGRRARTGANRRGTAARMPAR